MTLDRRGVPVTQAGQITGETRGGVCWIVKRDLFKMGIAVHKSFVHPREPQMRDRHTFTEDFQRDLRLIRASIIGGPPAMLAICLGHPDFPGPDAVLAYGRWISHPDRRAYRERIGETLTAELKKAKAADA